MTLKSYHFDNLIMQPVEWAIYRTTGIVDDFVSKSVNCCRFVWVFILCFSNIDDTSFLFLTFPQLFLVAFTVFVAVDVILYIYFSVIPFLNDAFFSVSFFTVFCVFVVAFSISKCCCSCFWFAYCLNVSVL